MYRKAQTITASPNLQIESILPSVLYQATMAVNLQSYIESVRDGLKPPVSNKILFDGDQIKVMVVGGPNQRKDFHIEKGEELFYMFVGDMDLDIMEEGTLKRIRIKEGDFFLLPACIPHSPQRYANTIGLVFERERLLGELDCLRWYSPTSATGTDGGNEVLYEEMFLCTDLGTQIKEVIERFNASTNTVAGPLMKTSSSSTDDYFKRSDLSSEYSKFTLQEEVETLSSAILETSDIPKTVSPIHGEFRVDLSSNSLPVAANCSPGGEVFLWQQSGVSAIYESALQSEGDLMVTREPTMYLNSGEVIHLKRRQLSNSTPILVSQMEPGGVVLCVSNNSVSSSK